ncbi:MAG: hypothetical protein U5J99_10910 [Parvularculaceae bacterium]|nr:hypothetical protein [Parvularculaceae bacterium]
MTYVEDASAGIIIVVPKDDALARERVTPTRAVAPWPRPAPRRDLISRLFPRKTRVEA